MGDKNGIDVKVQETMSNDVSHHLFDNLNSNMFMGSLGSLSFGLGSFENGSSSGSLGAFEDSLNMQQGLNIPGHLGSGFVNRGNEHSIFNGFDELGLAESLYQLHIGHGTSSIGDTRRNFDSQQGCGFGFDGNLFYENGHFVHSPVYHAGSLKLPNNGISGVHHTMGPFLDNLPVNALYPDVSFSHEDHVEYPFEVRSQELRSLMGENIVNQRPCITNSVIPGYNFHSSNQFEVNSTEDNLGFEMQKPYMTRAHVLGDDIYGFSGVADSLDVYVRDPLKASSRFSMLNERMSRASSSLGNHQAWMIGDMGMEAYSCRDDSIILEEAEKRMGHPQNFGTDFRLVKSLLKKSALCSRVQNGETRENVLAQSISQEDGPCGLGLTLENSWSISCIAKTQLGCRLLQRMLNERKYQDVQLIFNDVIDYVPELSLDQYGNYLVQKLLDVCNEEQITKVVRVITRNPGERIRICKNSHGTRVVQKIIQKVKTRKQIALLLKALEAGFLDLITDVNGNHVLLQCLQCFTEEHNKFIFEGAAKFCAKIATHRYGCCVLNQCIAQSSRRYREKLVTEICANGLLLAQDSFGNYVIQNILELKIPSAAAALLSALRGHFVLLSMQKCGSHVVEKCLKCCEQSEPIIIHELLSFPRFGQLLQHPFANYVIQSALQVTKGPVRSLLVKAVQQYKTLNNNPYCKKIFSRNLLK